MNLLTALRRRVAARSAPRRDKRLFRLLLLAAAALFTLLGLAVHYVYAGHPGDGDQLTLTTLNRLAASGRVATAVFYDEDAVIAGTYCAAAPAPGAACPAAQRRNFWTPYLHSDAATPALFTALQPNAEVSVDQQSRTALARAGVQFLLPLMLLADLFGLILVARGNQGGIAELAGFASIGRRRSRRMRLSTGVTFADVAGADEAVAELREVVDYLVDPKRYRAMGAQPPKGVLLYGPPGCGKTLLARAVAGEAGVPFFAISGAEFVESLVGVGAARVRDLFRQATQAAPAIVFIDELDAAGRRRGLGGSGGGSDEREQTLNQMLVAMDGFEVSSGIVVMGATNRPDILDPALLRPGRFDRHVMVDEPDVLGRGAILAVHARNRPLAGDVSLDTIAQRTPGFTGADLANVMNEATLLALREGHSEVRGAQVTEAVQRVLHGPRRRGHLLTDEERNRIAYHESGHVVVAASLGRLDEIARVSVVARGRGLGVSVISASSDRVLTTRSEMLAQLAIAMGGMISEEIVLGEPSTAAEDDVERVTHLARQIAGRYGMSAHIGAVRVLAHDVDGFLGGDDSVGEVSGEMLRDLEREVRRLSDEAARRARDALTRHRETLDRLAAALLLAETLEGHDLERVVADVAVSGDLEGRAALSSLTDVEV